MNIYYKHACLTKLALAISLLLVALWFFLFSSLSFGNPKSVAVYSIVDAGHNLSECPNTLMANEMLVHRQGKPSAQNSLASGNADNGGIPRLASVDVRAASTAELEPAECNHRRQSDQEPSSPSQTLSERGDVKCNAPVHLAENTERMNASALPSVTSSGDFSVQPAEVATKDL